MLKPGVYKALMRVAVEGKLEELVGGPNLTRRVLKHYPIERIKDCPSKKLECRRVLKSRDH